VPVGKSIQPRECNPDIQIGAPVFTMGFSGWGGQGMCQMRHAIVSTRDEERGLICVDTLTTQCNSGGPVWLAETGELIGTIQRGYTTTVRRKGKEVDTTQSLTGVASYKDFAGFLTL